MNEQKAIELLKKYDTGTISSDEKALLETWYLQQTENSSDQLSPEQLNKSVEHLKAQLPVKLGKERPLWSRIAAAASILLFLSTGAYILFHRQSAQQLAETQQYDIAPGTNHAILKIGHGKTVVLDSLAKGLIVQRGNININKTTEGQLVYSNNNTVAETQMVYDTLIVPAGSKPYHLALSDGTKLLVNVDSKIRFPEKFAANERKIDLLSGEVYFEVVHDDAKPLTIAVKGQSIKDIGTHFNINAYDNEPAVVTTLLEGSVNIFKGKESRTLTPGEQAIVKPRDNIIVKKADLEEVMAWKDGKFLYNSASLGVIMKQLERWYGVVVVFQNEGLKNKPFSIISTRFGMASQVLHNLEMTGDVKFKIEDKKIVVLAK